jgi:hypothetical protein
LVDYQTIEDNSLYNSYLQKFITREFLSSIINVLLYQANFSSIAMTKDSEVIKYFRKFSTEIAKDIKGAKSLQVSTRTILSSLSLIRKILDIKQNVSARLLTYDNIDQHFPPMELNVKKMIMDISNERIQSVSEFRKRLEDTMHTISMFFDFQTVRAVTYQWSQLLSDSNNEDITPTDFLRRFKENSIDSYNQINEITSLIKDESLDDYILFSDKESADAAAVKLMKFFETSYDTYSTGYQFLDDNINGIESSALYIISGPTNAAKSLFMLNLERQMIISNDTSQNDVFIHLTLEDNAYRLNRRLTSIFGNIDSAAAKSIYDKTRDIVKEEHRKEVPNQKILTDIKNYTKNIITDSVISVTHEKATLLVKHSADNNFTCNDLAKILDQQEHEGRNIKAIFIDYLDLLVPSTKRYDNGSDYDTQGAVVHEMRNLAQRFSAPVITITQNARSSENNMQTLNNAQLGDSYKKARYADYIIQVRLRRDMAILDEAVKTHIMDDSTNFSIADLANYSQYTMLPFEIKITKAKDGNKDLTSYMLFSGQSLRIYEKIDQLTREINPCNAASKSLLNTINTLGISTTIDFDEEDDALDSLIV